MSTRKRTASDAYQHRIIDLLGGKLKAGANIFCFKESIILEDFGFRHTVRQHVQNVFYPDAIMPNTRASAALLRVKRDAIR